MRDRNNEIAKMLGKMEANEFENEKERYENGGEEAGGLALDDGLFHNKLQMFEHYESIRKL